MKSLLFKHKSTTVETELIYTHKWQKMSTFPMQVFISIIKLSKRAQTKKNLNSTPLQQICLDHHREERPPSYKGAFIISHEDKNSCVRLLHGCLADGEVTPMATVPIVTRLFLSPGSVWSPLCICRRTARPSCWTWRSSRWCNRCQNHRCRLGGDCISRAFQS